MKKIKLINLLLIVATSLLLVNCTTEPIPGPAGSDGINGTDGTDGVDGASGTTECAVCHNVETSEDVHASYLFSMHSIETDMYDGSKLSTYGNRSSCAQCHTNEGFKDYATTGTVTGEAYPSAVQTISCNTCHDTHTTFDFENDGFDYALRLVAPVQLIADNTYTLDFEGTSNTCAQCHQPRKAPPVDDGSGIYTVYNRYGPHHGPQSTFLEGIQGGEIAGFEYPAAGSAFHRTGSSCTSCHMGETSGEIDGNHTWIPTPTTCTECHTNGAPESVDGLEEDMLVLGLLLADNGLLDENGDVVLGDYPIAQAQALWNFVLIEEDGSMGTHNPNYAKALIKNSIEALSAN